MKKSVYVLLAALILLIFTLGCAKAQIENTIADFEAAANKANGEADLTETISEDSHYYDPLLIKDFHNTYLYPELPSYGSLDIDVSGGDADVFTTADYQGQVDAVNVQFIMKRHGFFLFPSWKVKEYWDDASGSMSMIFQKIKNEQIKLNQ
jgi:hypothetical protein